jgi:glycosyltransferase involved in cell wall biosynthesis
VEPIAVLARGELRRPSTWRHPESAGPVGESLPSGLRTAVLPLPVPVLYDSWARRGRPTVTSCTGPVDLVHVTVPMQVAVGDAPMVATVHDLFPLTRPQDFTHRGARLMRDGLQWLLGAASMVMVPSPTVAEACLGHGVHEHRVRVVPWGADPVVVDVRRVAAVTERLGVRGPYVLVVGTREPRKNLRGVLAAMAALDRPDVTLVVVGPSGWGDEPDPVAAGVASPVAMLGEVDRAELTALYAGASVFCYPSMEEGFGLPVLEAMAAGAPVVTSTGTATADVAGDAALLVDPGRPLELADALARVLGDPGLARSLRDAGRRRADELGWDATAAATLAVYREVLGK